MYHIKSDSRSQNSAAVIVRGVQECLKTTPLKAITITDIHRTTGISRATFYRLFDTPEDVLLYQLDHMAIQVANYYETEWRTASARLLEEAVATGMYYHDFIRALIENGRFDLLYQYTEKIFRILDEKKGIFPQNVESLERNYVIAYFSMSMVASLITWAKNGRQETPAEVVKHMKIYIRVTQELLGETE